MNSFKWPSMRFLQLEMMQCKPSNFFMNKMVSYLAGTFKGFELLMQYLIKHTFEVDLKNLDFEVIDKEREADETSVAKDVSL